jgi:hypothetical protein
MACANYSFGYDKPEIEHIVMPFSGFEVQKTKFAHFTLFLSKEEFVDNF